MHFIHRSIHVAAIFFYFFPFCFFFWTAKCRAQAARALSGGLNGNVCMPDSQREMENRQRRSPCVHLKCLFSKRANILLGGSGGRQPLHPRQTFLHLKHFFFPHPASPWWDGGGEEGQAMCLFPSFSHPSPARLQSRHQSPETFFFHAVSHWWTHLFYLPPAIHYLRYWLKDTSQVSRKLILFTALKKREICPTALRLLWAPLPLSTTSSLHPCLAHLLEAVRKVGASCAVFARLR